MRQHPPMHHYTLRMAREHHVLLWVPSPQDHHAFQLVPVCTIYRVVCISGIAVLKGETSCPWCDIHHKNYITIIGVPGWAPAETTCVAWLVDSEPPQLWPESSSVVTENKGNNDMLSYQIRVSKLEWDGFMDLASRGPGIHPMLLGQSKCSTSWAFALHIDWAEAIHFRGHALYYSYTVPQGVDGCLPRYRTSDLGVTIQIGFW